MLDVIATGKSTLTITVTWTATVQSTAGSCFGMPPPERTIGDPVELPAKDDAMKTVNHPSEVGNYSKTYILHIKWKEYLRQMEQNESFSLLKGCLAYGLIFKYQFNFHPYFYFVVK